MSSAETERRFAAKPWTFWRGGSQVPEQLMAGCWKIGWIPAILLCFHKKLRCLEGEMIQFTTGVEYKANFIFICSHMSRPIDQRYLSLLLWRIQSCESLGPECGPRKGLYVGNQECLISFSLPVGLHLLPLHTSNRKLFRTVCLVSHFFLWVENGELLHIQD